MASLFSIGTNSTHLVNASVMLKMCLYFVPSDFKGPTKSKCILWFLPVGVPQGVRGTLFFSLFLSFCWWHILHILIWLSMSWAIDGQKYFMAIASYVLDSLQCPPRVEPWWFSIIIVLSFSGTHNLLDCMVFFLLVKTYNNPLFESMNDREPYNVIMVCM